MSPPARKFSRGALRSTRYGDLQPRRPLANPRKRPARARARCRYQDHRPRALGHPADGSDTAPHDPPNTFQNRRRGGVARGGRTWRRCARDRLADLPRGPREPALAIGAAVRTQLAGDSRPPDGVLGRAALHRRGRAWHDRGGHHAPPPQRDHRPYRRRLHPAGIAGSAGARPENREGKEDLSMPGALAGIRVFDMSRVLAGPSCAQLLGDLGADVIKVERPGEGDDTRKWGPPYLKDAEGRDTTESAYYLAANRAKRSLTLDFTNPAGRDLARRLIACSDVLIENYKVGTLAKHGLGYADLRAEFPRLVYCSITGFGQTGPYTQRA